MLNCIREYVRPVDTSASFLLMQEGHEPFLSLYSVKGGFAKEEKIR